MLLLGREIIPHDEGKFRAIEPNALGLKFTSRLQIAQQINVGVDMDAFSTFCESRFLNIGSIVEHLPGFIEMAIFFIDLFGGAQIDNALPGVHQQLGSIFDGVGHFSTNRHHWNPQRPTDDGVMRGYATANNEPLHIFSGKLKNVGGQQFVGNNDLAAIVAGIILFIEQVAHQAVAQILHIQHLLADRRHLTL